MSSLIFTKIRFHIQQPPSGMHLYTVTQSQQKLKLVGKFVTTKLFVEYQVH